jgi:hypothetical protein
MKDANPMQDIHDLADLFIDRYIAGNPTAPTLHVFIDADSKYFHGTLPVSGKPIFRDEIDGAQVFLTEDDLGMQGTYLPAPHFLIKGSK